MMSTVTSFGPDLHVEDVAEGLLVHQGNESYVARDWRLTAPVAKLIEKAIASGLGCMIREDHPRRNSRWPNTRGTVYLAFSPSPDLQWSLAIDTFRSARGDFGLCAFNGKYQEQFRRAGIPFVFEARNKTAGHLMVPRAQIFEVLDAIAKFDHSVLTLNRGSTSSDGFPTEYVIQRVIMNNWDTGPFADRYAIVQDEFPVDGGLTSRRIDILAKDWAAGDWLVIELKRAEANVEAVHQVENYLHALARRDDFALGRIDGVLIAERISKEAKAAALNANITTYEVRWPGTLHEV